MKMKILKVGLILIAVFIVLTIVFSIAASFLSPRLVFEEEREVLGKDRLRVVRAGPIGDIFCLGDAIVYQIKILYADGIEIIGIRTNLSPFTIRETIEKYFRLDKETNVYLKEYKIQLIDGRTNTTYYFPALIRYRDKDKAGDRHLLLEKEIKLQSIFLSPRLPANITGFELRPVAPGILHSEVGRISKIFWALGGLLVILAVVLAERKIQIVRKTRKRLLGKRERLKDILQAYDRLQNKEMDAKELLHAIHQLLCGLLASEEGIDWLEPELDKIAPAIRSQVLALLEKCQNAYKPETLEREEGTKALDNLRKILDFYLKEERGA